MNSLRLATALLARPVSRPLALAASSTGSQMVVILYSFKILVFYLTNHLNYP